MIYGFYAKLNIDETMLWTHNVDSGGAVMDEITYRTLDIKKLQEKKHTVVSSDEALMDVVPIEWDADVVSGKKRVLLTDKN